MPRLFTSRQIEPTRTPNLSGVRPDCSWKGKIRRQWGKYRDSGVRAWKGASITTRSHLARTDLPHRNLL